MRKIARWPAVPVVFGLFLAVVMFVSPALLVAAASGSGHLFATLSDASPGYHATETVTATFTDENDQPVSGLRMKTTWYAKGHKTACSGTTDAQGVASCSREVKAKAGQTVKVLVRIKYHKHIYEREVQFTVA